MEEIYISTDVEADGFLPGENSMLSFASAAFKKDKTLLGTFSANLHTLPNATTNPKVMTWWKAQPAAWEACRQDLQKPEVAMANYLEWLKTLHGKLVFVGYPVVFDYMFIYWYLYRFTGQNPFSFSALDIKTYAMAVLKIQYKKSVKYNMPSEWFDAEHPHTHVALDDAIEQGILFCSMLQQNLA